MSRTTKADDAFIAGRHPVREALERSGSRIEKVFVQRGVGGRDLSEIRTAASDLGLQVQHVPQQKLDRLVPGVNHQGVVAQISGISYTDLHDLLQDLAADRDELSARKPRLLVIDGIQDPFNFGGILRSAVASGAGGVIVPERNMAPLNAAALKASAGTAARIPIARVRNVADVLYELKERGYWIAGAVADGDTSVWEMDWNRPVALVIGSESAGIRRRVIDACDYRVYIPMRGDAESLNASVAAGVLMFAATRG